MGVPIWLPAQPWRRETPGVEVTTVQDDQERVITAKTSKGTLVARWVVGPDGDWWQSEYPVKTAEDLALSTDIVGSDAAKVKRVDYFIPEVGKGAEILEGSMDEKIDRVIELLKAKGGLK